MEIACQLRTDFFSSQAYESMNTMGSVQSYTPYCELQTALMGFIIL